MLGIIVGLILVISLTFCICLNTQYVKCLKRFDYAREKVTMSVLGTFLVIFGVIHSFTNLDLRQFMIGATVAIIVFALETVYVVRRAKMAEKSPAK